MLLPDSAISWKAPSKRWKPVRPKHPRLQSWLPELPGQAVPINWQTPFKAVGEMVIFALEPVEKPHGQPITQIKTAALKPASVILPVQVASLHCPRRSMLDLFKTRSNVAIIP